MREISYEEYKRLYDAGIVESIQKLGKSGVVSKIERFGTCLDVLLNRKEGVVGSVLRIKHQKLLKSGEEE